MQVLEQFFYSFGPMFRQGSVERGFRQSHHAQGRKAMQFEFVEVTPKSAGGVGRGGLQDHGGVAPHACGVVWGYMFEYLATSTRPLARLATGLPA